MIIESSFPNVSTCSDKEYRCTSLIIGTNFLVCFSLIYAFCRLGLMCCWLLHNSEVDDEDLEERTNCLWGIIGVVLIFYEVILSAVLFIGVGIFIFEVKGFFILMFCINYPIFLILHWIFGFFLTKCFSAQIRMKRSSPYNCLVVIFNLFWRGVLYWCALNLLFHP